VSLRGELLGDVAEVDEGKDHLDEEGQVGHELCPQGPFEGLAGTHAVQSLRPRGDLVGAQKPSTRAV
jgi:hypothetical protein